MIIDGVVTTNHYQALALTGTGEVYHEFKGLIKKLLGPVFLNPEALSSEISQSLTPRDICRFAMDTDRPNRWDKFDYGTLL
jgi:hypothetical protein